MKGSHMADSNAMWRVVGLLLTLAGLSTAAAPVEGVQPPQSTQAAGPWVIVVLDNSRSTADSSTLSFVRGVVTLISRTDPTTKWRLVTFDSTATAGVERHMDANSMIDALATVDGAGRYTNINTGLSKALTVVESAPKSPAPGVVLLVTDGISAPPRGTDVEALDRALSDSILPRYISLGIPVFVTCPTDRADVRRLRLIADATDGMSLVTKDAGKMAEAVSARMRIPEGSSVTSARPTRDNGTWVLLLTILAGVLLLLVLTGIGLLMRSRSSRGSATSGPRTGQDAKVPAVAGVAEAVADLRALGSQTGDLGGRLGELAKSIEHAGGLSWNEAKDAEKRARQLLAAVVGVRDELEELKAGLAGKDTRSRESLEYIDEQLVKALRQGDIAEMDVQVGGPCDAAVHEIQPESGSEPAGTILRVRQKGYVRRTKTGIVVFRPARVIVSDGKGRKES